jgi:hypothetical protein
MPQQPCQNEYARDDRLVANPLGKALSLPRLTYPGGESKSVVAFWAIAPPWAMPSCHHQETGELATQGGPTGDDLRTGPPRSDSVGITDPEGRHKQIGDATAKLARLSPPTASAQTWLTCRRPRRPSYGEYHGSPPCRAWTSRPTITACPAQKPPTNRSSDDGFPGMDTSRSILAGCPHPRHPHSPGSPGIPMTPSRRLCQYEAIRAARPLVGRNCC